MPYILPMFTFVETRLFTRLVADYLDEVEYSAVQEALAASPDAGAVIPGSGGIRKLRWGQPGRGKRGGIRIIYYVKRTGGVIWMLTIFAKNEASDIPLDVLRRIREQVDG